MLKEAAHVNQCFSCRPIVSGFSYITLWMREPECRAVARPGSRGHSYSLPVQLLPIWLLSSYYSLLNSHTHRHMEHTNANTKPYKDKATGRLRLLHHASRPYSDATTLATSHSDLHSTSRPAYNYCIANITSHISHSATKHSSARRSWQHRTYFDRQHGR